MNTTEHLRQLIAIREREFTHTDGQYYLANEDLSYYLIEAAPALLDVVDAARDFLGDHDGYRGDLATTLAKLDEVKL